MSFSLMINRSEYTKKGSQETTISQLRGITDCTSDTLTSFVAKLVIQRLQFSFCKQINNESSYQSLEKHSYSSQAHALIWIATAIQAIYFWFINVELYDKYLRFKISNIYQQEADSLYIFPSLFLQYHDDKTRIKDAVKLERVKLSRLFSYLSNEYSNLHRF